MSELESQGEVVFSLYVISVFRCSQTFTWRGCKISGGWAWGEAWESTLVISSLGDADTAGLGTQLWEPPLKPIRLSRKEQHFMQFPRVLWYTSPDSFSHLVFMLFAHLEKFIVMPHPLSYGARFCGRKVTDYPWYFTYCWWFLHLSTCKIRSVKLFIYMSIRDLWR